MRRMKLAFAGVYLLAIMTQFACDTRRAGTEAKEKAINFYNKGNEQARRQEYAAAIESYTKALELDPDSKEAYLNRGIARVALPQPLTNLATRDFSNALRLDKNYEKAYFLRGVNYSNMAEQGNFYLLILSNSDLARFVQVTGDSKRKGIARRVLFKNHAAYETAIFSEQQPFSTNAPGLTARQRDARVYLIDALDAIGRRSYKEGIDNLNEALKNDRILAEAYCARGVALFCLERKVEARSDFERAIEQDAMMERPKQLIEVCFGERPKETRTEPPTQSAGGRPHAIEKDVGKSKAQASGQRDAVYVLLRAYELLSKARSSEKPKTLATKAQLDECEKQLKSISSEGNNVEQAESLARSRDLFLIYVNYERIQPGHAPVGGEMLVALSVLMQTLGIDGKTAEADGQGQLSKRIDAILGFSGELEKKFNRRLTLKDLKNISWPNEPEEAYKVAVNQRLPDYQRLRAVVWLRVSGQEQLVSKAISQIVARYAAEEGEWYRRATVPGQGFEGPKPPPISSGNPGQFGSDAQVLSKLANLTLSAMCDTLTYSTNVESRVGAAYLIADFYSICSREGMEDQLRLRVKESLLKASKEDQDYFVRLASKGGIESLDRSEGAKLRKKNETAPKEED